MLSYPGGRRPHDSCLYPQNRLGHAIAASLQKILPPCPCMTSLPPGRHTCQAAIQNDPGRQLQDLRRLWRGPGRRTIWQRAVGWRCRLLSRPLAVLSQHAHRVWQAKFNPRHDQLLLTASSDVVINLHQLNGLGKQQVLSPIPDLDPAAPGAAKPTVPATHQGGAPAICVHTGSGLHPVIDTAKQALNSWPQSLFVC